MARWQDIRPTKLIVPLTAQQYERLVRYAEKLRQESDPTAKPSSVLRNLAFQAINSLGDV